MEACEKRKHSFTALIAVLFVVVCVWFVPGAIQQSREVAKAKVVAKAIDEAPVATIITDRNGIIKSFSDAAEKLFEVKADKVIGKSYEWMIPPEYLAEHRNVLANFTYKKDGEVRDIESDVIDWPGVRFRAKCRIQAVPEGDSYSFIVSIVSVRKLQQITLPRSMP